jgi:hypothetical protein
MATVTDLTSNSISQVDTTTLSQARDSNVNVYEFGNLILADILPTLILMVSTVSDYLGNLLSATDITESSVSVEDTTVTSLSLEDWSGNSSSVTDLSVGSTVEDSNINVYEFGNLLLAGIFPTILIILKYVLDREGTAVDLTDVQVEAITEQDTTEETVSVTEHTESNSMQYDYNEYTYEDTHINYNGYPCQGVIVDISGS